MNFSKVHTKAAPVVDYNGGGGKAKKEKKEKKAKSKFSPIGFRPPKPKPESRWLNMHQSYLNVSHEFLHYVSCLFITIYSCECDMNEEDKMNWSFRVLITRVGTKSPQHIKMYDIYFFCIVIC